MRKGFKPKTKERGLWIALVLMMAAVIIFLFAGCSGPVSTAKEAVSETQYLSFILGKFTSMSQSAQTLQNQMTNFSASSLTDDTWVSATKDAIASLQSDCDAIIAYTDVPNKYADLHKQLTDLAAQGKSALTDYSAGIDNKDLNTLISANAKLAQMAGDMSTYVDTLKSQTNQ